MSLQFPNKLKSGECVTIPVDVKQSKDFLPIVACAPIDAAAVTDDRATICRGTAKDGSDMYSVHFKSELAGPFGAGVSSDYKTWHNENSWFMMPYKAVGMMLAKLSSPDAYSKYEFQVTSDAISLLRRKSPASKLPSETYAVDAPDRAALVVSSAIACWGYHAEDAELVQFAKTMNDTKFGTCGDPLPTRDRIDQQKGGDLPQRDFAALNAQPNYSSFPALGASTSEATRFPFLPKVINPFTIAVDVKANDLFPANMNFAPLNAEVVTNDRVLMWSEWDMFCVRFKSEVGGPLGGLDVARNLPRAVAGGEQFSPYALCVNSAKQVFARGIADNKQYKVDLVDRAVLILASALGAAAYTQNDFSLKLVAEGVYAARNSMTTVGDELPVEDRLRVQTRTAYGATDLYQEHAEMTSNYCMPRSPNYSFWMCAVAGMGSPSL